MINACTSSIRLCREGAGGGSKGWEEEEGRDGSVDMTAILSPHARARADLLASLSSVPPAVFEGKHRMHRFQPHRIVHFRRTREATDTLPGPAQTGASVSQQPGRQQAAMRDCL
jgi:hypothetical protein